MRRHHRAILTGAALASAFALAGCETTDIMDKLQDMIPFGDSKKPLPGERRQVFPEGVPGVPQGVPPDMVKGNQPPPDAAPPPQQAAVPPPEKPKPKKKLQAKPKPPAEQPPPAQSQAVVQPAPPPSAWPPPMQPPNSTVSPWPAPPTR